MRFSLLLIPLVVLTLAPRIAAQSETAGGDNSRLLDDIAASLETQGFVTRLDDRPEMDNIVGTRGDCELSVAGDHRNGERLSAFEKIQPPERAETHLFYRGSRVERLPRLRPAVNFYAQRHLAKLGILYDYAPVIMVAAGPGCDLSRLEFNALHIFPAQ